MIIKSLHFNLVTRAFSLCNKVEIKVYLEKLHIKLNKVSKYTTECRLAINQENEVFSNNFEVKKR